MFFTKFFVACAAIMAGTTNAASIHMYNHCDHEINFYITEAGVCDMGPEGCHNEGADPFELSPGGGSHTHEFIANGAGTAIKFSHAGQQDFHADGILQFEYTVNTDQDVLYYDLSDIDGGSSFDEALQITPEGGSAGEDTCQEIICEEGEGCGGAYQFPSDDTKMHSCSADTDLIYTYCP